MSYVICFLPFFCSPVLFLYFLLLSVLSPYFRSLLNFFTICLPFSLLPLSIFTCFLFFYLFFSVFHLLPPFLNPISKLVYLLPYSVPHFLLSSFYKFITLRLLFLCPRFHSFLIPLLSSTIAVSSLYLYLFSATSYCTHMASFPRWLYIFFCVFPGPFHHHLFSRYLLPRFLSFFVFQLVSSPALLFLCPATPPCALVIFYGLSTSPSAALITTTCALFFFFCLPSLHVYLLGLVTFIVFFTLFFVATLSATLISLPTCAYLYDFFFSFRHLSCTCFHPVFTLFYNTFLATFTLYLALTTWI